MKNYVINATSVLKDKDNERNIALVAADLTTITQRIPQIKQIVLRGGGAIDVVSGKEPNDIDLFYSYFVNGKKIKKCVCEKIKNKMTGMSFQYLKDKEIDLENTYEKEPRLDPINRTVGLFSYHTDYNSQFAIDKNGQIWTNTDALKYHTNGVYEVCYESFLPWAYFPREGDSQNYWSFQAYMLIRGIAYVTGRNLIPGEKFMRMFGEHERIIKHGIMAKGVEGFQKYAKSKIKTHYNFVVFLEKYVRKEDWGRVLKIFLPVLEKCK